MKIIFLDIDGTLNNAEFYNRKAASDFESINHPYNEFDPNSIDKLNWLVNETGAKVVITSTWRLGYTLEQLQQLFFKLGFKGEIISMTGIGCRECVRGNEIFTWIKNNQELLGYESYFEYDKYVILDDDSDMLLRQKNNFIQVDRQVGITNTVIYTAIKILNGKALEHTECLTFRL